MKLVYEKGSPEAGKGAPKPDKEDSEPADAGNTKEPEPQAGASEGRTEEAKSGDSENEDPPLE